MIADLQFAIFHILISFPSEQTISGIDAIRILRVLVSQNTAGEESSQ
jgi:hypothetical protein